jgi:hypothetical protein
MRCHFCGGTIQNMEDECEHCEVFPDLGPTHFRRTCEFCGFKWEGLHCPHDGYQNPCSKCKKYPTRLDESGGECNCEPNV